MNKNQLTILERVLYLEQMISTLQEKLSNPIVETQCFDLMQACKFLGVSKSTMYRIMRSREIGFITVGGHRKFTRTELEKYIEKNSRMTFKTGY